MIKSITLDPKKHEDYHIIGTENSTLNDIAKVNLFIGSNNSGKSRFLRKLFSDDYTISFDQSMYSVNAVIEELVKKYNLYIQERSIQFVRVSTSLGMTRLDDYLKACKLNTYSKDNTYKKLSESVKRWDDLKDYTDGDYMTANNQILELRSSEKTLINSIANKLKELYDKPFTWNLYEIYIPVLRGLRPIGITDNSSDNYHERTCRDYFHDVVFSQKEVFSGQKLYDKVKELLLNNRENRRLIRDFENFLSSSFFPGEIITLIPHIEKDVLYIGIGNEEEREIYNLGDGIQSLIILLFPLFTNKDKNLLVYIEEPETHLHPGYQRLFIETLLKPEFAKFQYFITTHSNHFLDITLDFDNISIYSFRKELNSESGAKFSIENLKEPNNNILELIGARTSSVFLSNCTVWLEGITDRLYLRKYLEIYQKSKLIKYREDYHFSFVEYGGNNNTHWSFLDSEDTQHPNINVERLCSRLFLITDNDGTGLTKSGEPPKNKRKKYERHLQLAKKLGNRYYCLEAIEIENILSKHIIKATIESFEGTNAKNLNFKLFEKNKHEKEPLGAFVDKNIEHRKKSYCSDSNSVKNKVEFCKTAISHIHTIDDLSDEAKKLCEKIYNFIKANND